MTIITLATRGWEVEKGGARVSLLIRPRSPSHQYKSAEPLFRWDSRPLSRRGVFPCLDPVISHYNLVADWDRTWHRSSEDPVTKVLNDDIDRTALEVLTAGDVLKGTFEFSGGSGPRTITNALLVAALGGETDFKLRAWFVRSGYRNLNFDEVTVRKV